MATELWKRYKTTGGRRDRDLIVDHYLPFVKRIAFGLYRYWSASEIVPEDFIQHGMVGLLEAVDGFDETGPYPFEVYARHRIRGSILNSISKYSENLDYRAYRRRIETDRLKSIDANVASGAQSSLSRFIELTASAAVIHILDEDSTAEFEQFQESSPYAQPVEFSLRAQLLELIQGMTTRAGTVLELHYVEGLTFKEIADLLALSKASISSLHSKGIAELRQLYREEHVDAIG